jgi:hypothetical protein
MSQIEDAPSQTNKSSSENSPVSSSQRAQAFGTDPQLSCCYEVFLRDLPGLLSDHAGQWVAYAANRQIGIHASKRSLYRQCIAAGHSDGEFLICGIEPPQAIVLDDLLDV